MNPGPATVPAPRRLLVRGVNWMGDALMTTPAMMRLREALPGTHLALLTHEKLADLWTLHPAIDQLLVFRRGQSIWSVGQTLRAEGFDAALVLPNSPRAALEPWLAGIRRRIGIERPWRNWLLTQAVSTAPGAARLRQRGVSKIRARLAGALTPEVYPAGSHHLHHYLHLAGALGASTEPGAPFLKLAASERVSALAHLFPRAHRYSGPAEVWFGLNPGAEYGPAKRWPAEHYARAANAIHQRTNCKWMVFGGPAERPLAERILEEVPSAASLCGQTTLRELMAGLAACRLLLTNDTGPMHLAAALGTPVVALFGSTSPELTGPGLPGDFRHTLVRSAVACAPCFRRACPVDFRCMTGIREDEVTEAVVAAWERQSGL